QEAGGHIGVESEIGKGTTFDVYLPRTVDLPEKAPAVPGEEAVWSGTGTILVAEDEPSVRKLFADVLGAAGYDTLLAKDGLEAVELDRSHPDRIDLFLTDMVMPGMSGDAAAKHVHAHHPEAQVLVMSGYTAEAGEIEAAQTGRVSFIPKPISPRELL